MDKNNVDTTQQLQTVISFCSGYGGIERGLDLAGVEHRVLAYVEIEAFAIANLVAKMETGQLVPAPIFTDIKTFPAHLFRGCVDIITGGYPCQPFSAAGKRLGTEDSRHLWPYILDHIKAIRPVRCMFENVEGHISLGLREVIGDLESASYNSTWGIFSAAEVGAPHQRKRVYILANAEGQRYGAGREQRDIYQSDGGSVWECLSEPPLTGLCAGGDEIVATPTVRANTAANLGPNGKRDLLVNQVNWQTPVANDSVERAKGNYNSRGEPNWPTPSARDWKDSPGMAQTTVNPDGSHRNRNDQLARAVYSVTPPAGSLNPDWVEWLMGVPIGWTDLGSWETE
jgi:site-specific DNA-cytosine methylase